MKSRSPREKRFKKRRKNMGSNNYVSFDIVGVKHEGNMDSFSGVFQSLCKPSN